MTSLEEGPRGVRSVTTATLSHVRAGVQRARERLVTGAWALVQQTVAGTVAWVLAKRVFDHHDPFFAPIAAVVALNAVFGERGSNALRLLQGVVVGIVVGEITLAGFGSGSGRLAIALFIAMAIARATGGARVTVAQAAVGAILTVAVGNGEIGVERLEDALIGSGVALVFTQFLFSPEPLRLLHRAEAVVLTGLAKGLRLTGQALADSDQEVAGRAVETLPKIRDHLTELARARQASTRVAGHSLVWRWKAAPVAREKENALHLDILGDSCLMLIRTAVALRGSDGSWLAPHVHELSDTLGDLAQNPDDRTTRQRAVSRSLHVTRQLTHDLTVHQSPTPESPLQATVILIRIAAVEIMEFSRVHPG
ncbi:MAG TPA: FUSC family protein [Pseudonocardiaceae bacterium]|nr:FUSC family protein [Pseudonocardiaceae bacterium]